MRRSTIRKIEDILRDYPKIDDYIEEREQQLRYPTGQTDENIGGGRAQFKYNETVLDTLITMPWHELKGNLFLNPPYGRELRKWVKKAYEESLKKHDGYIVLLIPARTDTSYWHDFIFGKAQIIFLRGRLKFELHGESKDAAPFPLALVIYGGTA